MNIHHLNINGETILVREAGTTGKPCVLWFHSLGTSSELWAPQFEALKDTHHLIALDCRSHGGSTNSGGFSVNACVDDALALMREMNVKHAHVVGLSMGGLMAGELAARMATTEDMHCDSIVLACAYRTIGGRQAQARIEATRATLAEKGMAAFAKMYMDGTASEYMDATTKAHMAAIIAGMKPDDYVQTIDSILNHDVGPALAKVNDVPTLVLSGRLDKRVTPDALAELIGAVAQAQTVELERAGHLANIEDAEGFTRAILQFWTAVH